MADLERTHEQEQEYLKLLHDNKMAEEAAARAHEVTLIEARKDVELANATAKNNAALAALKHKNETEKSWTRTELGVSAGVVGLWVVTVVAVIAVVLWKTNRAEFLPELITLLTLAFTVAKPAAERIYGNVFKSEKKDESSTE